MNKKRRYTASDASSQPRGVQQRVRQMLEIERLCTRFHLIAQQLQKRHDNRETLRVNDEHDLWDLLRALLALEHDDVREVTWTPAHADHPRTDLLLKIERTVLVAKMANAGFDTASLTAQLLNDIEHYRAHPDCQMLVCFVYDPEGRMSQPAQIEHELSSEQDGLNVRVMIAPKGI